MSGSDPDTDTPSVENTEQRGGGAGELPANFTDGQIEELADAVKDRIIDDAAEATGGADSEKSDLSFTEATEQVIEALGLVNDRIDIMNDRLDVVEDHIDEADDDADDSTDVQPTSDHFRGFQ